jgi:hypothetical protein
MLQFQLALAAFSRGWGYTNGSSTATLSEEWMQHSRRFSLLVGVIGFVALIKLAPTFAAEPAPSTPGPVAGIDTMPVAASIGDTAPDFTLTDTDGVSWHLADLTAAGKVVVLEWFSPTCPTCEAYYEQGEDGSASMMEEIIASVAGDDLVWLAVNSAAPDQGGDPAENAQTKLDWHVGPSILLDPTGNAGHSFGAQTTPTICIISAKGKLVYRGAPDDDGVGEDFPGINFVARAVTQLRTGEPVSIKETRSFG